MWSFQLSFLSKITSKNLALLSILMFSLQILIFILGILFLLVKRTPVVLLIEILKPFWSHQLCMISIDCCILFIRILTFLCPVYIALSSAKRDMSTPSTPEGISFIIIRNNNGEMTEP